MGGGGDHGRARGLPPWAPEPCPQPASRLETRNFPGQGRAALLGLGPECRRVPGVSLTARGGAGGSRGWGGERPAPSTPPESELRPPARSHVCPEASQLSSVRSGGLPAGVPGGSQPAPAPGPWAPAVPSERVKLARASLPSAIGWPPDHVWAGHMAPRTQTIAARAVVSVGEREAPHSLLRAVPSRALPSLDSSKKARPGESL